MGLEASSLTSPGFRFPRACLIWRSTARDMRSRRREEQFATPFSILARHRLFRPQSAEKSTLTRPHLTGGIPAPARPAGAAAAREEFRRRGNTRDERTRLVRGAT